MKVGTESGTDSDLVTNVGTESGTKSVDSVVNLANTYMDGGVEPTSAVRQAAHDCGYEWGTESMREIVVRVLNIMSGVNVERYKINRPACSLYEYKVDIDAYVWVSDIDTCMSDADIIKEYELADGLGS